MKYCSHCKVYIRDSRKKCTLCGNFLSSNGNGGEEVVFPLIPPSYERHLAIKITAFISIIIIVLSFSIDMIFPSKIRWPILVVLGLSSMWIGLFFLIRGKYHMPKKIIQQVAILSLLAIFWDWKIGWRGWSLDFVIPIVFMGGMITIYVIAKIMKLSVKDYITYALIDGLFGIIPFLFMVLGWTKVIYPTIVCVGLSMIFLSALFIFHGKDIIEELNKRMHI